MNQVKEWVTIEEAAYLVGRHKSRLYRWLDKGLLRHRRGEKGLLEVASADVTKAEETTRRGRPRKARDTP